MAAQISNLANSAQVEEEDSDSDSDLDCYGCVDEVTEEKKESKDQYVDPISIAQFEIDAAAFLEQHGIATA